MSGRDTYPAGVPCWVETWQPDVDAAAEFYRALFGWEVVGPGPVAGDPAGRYFVARLRGRTVAGLASADVDRPATWTTQIRVDDVQAAAATWVERGGTVLAGPLDAAPAGRTVVLADPAGAVCGLWQAGDREGAEVVNEPGAWVMSTLHTPDPAGDLGFYGGLFGWACEPAGPGPAQLVRLPGHVGGEPGQPVPRDVVALARPVGAAGFVGWVVGFRTDDVDALLERADRGGGRVLSGPTAAGGFVVATLADPQGAEFSVSQVLVPFG